MQQKLNRSKAFFVLLALGAGFVLSACNTIEGAGRDIESAGDSIADTAEDASD